MVELNNKFGRPGNIIQTRYLSQVFHFSALKVFHYYLIFIGEELNHQWLVENILPQVPYPIGPF